jgi:aryl-alcohol dehydrogenase-like predicted oxidoreductase
MPPLSIEDRPTVPESRSTVAAPHRAAHLERAAPLGFGAFKIGRNVGIKYPTHYDLPDDQTVERLLNGVLDLGCNLIDTAPAYGTSEERVGKAIGDRRKEYLLATKVGEFFENGQSRYDFSPTAITSSLHHSLKRLRTDILDVVHVHATHGDVQLQQQSPLVETLQAAKAKGLTRAIGFSAKTIEGAALAIEWADAIMVEFHSLDQSALTVMQKAYERGVAVFIKKGLASGHLPAAEAIRFILKEPSVQSLIIGGLSLAHFTENWTTAAAVDRSRS